jgi:ABC-type multidrug transport system fused ATPase/permease subunit
LKLASTAINISRHASASWPSLGVVEFHEVHAKYRENLPTVLNGVTFSVKAGEKIGVVGRTGAGKSSLTLCLLRILELCGGKILIDGVDISALSLEELRSAITIIL